MTIHGAAQPRALTQPPQNFWRVIVAALMVFAWLSAAGEAALAKAKFSAITVDARTGKVLSAIDPDGMRHPASLTKMMTLYLVFQDLKAGKIKLNSPIRLSARAAAMAPSKLGVKPGTAITVETAIKALVVKSANDVASAVGETLGGSESAFAERMTRTARELGMSHTTFRNASGLPSPNQWTTARDMATLGLRLQRDFPQYYPYFRAMAFTYAGRTTKTHNRLLGRFEGTDGIKTGYIATSGFNLVTSVKRGNKRIVGVVMGGTSGRSRDTYMKNMLTKVLPKGTGGTAIAALAGSSKGAIDPKENTKQAADETLDAMADASSGDEENAANDDVPEKAAETPTVIEAKVAAPAVTKDLPFEVKPEAKQAEVTPEVTEPGNTQTIASLASGEWNIQIGSYPTKKAATTKLIGLRTSGPIELRDKQGFTVTVKKGEKTTYRARFSGFTEEDARNTCKELMQDKLRCYVVGPSS